MTIDTRDVNDFGPGKFKTSADNNLGKYCYFNRSNTDSRFRCYLARHNNSKPDKLVFLIDERNCSIDISNKSSDFVLTRSQSNGTPIGAGKSSDKENYSNGRPEVDEGRTRDRSVDATESAFSRGGRGWLLLEQRRDDTKRNKRDRDTNRKKLRFLSD